MDRLRRNFERDPAELPVPSSRLGWPVVTDADLVALPVAYDRWCALPTGLVGAPGRTPIDDWIVVDDRPSPGVAAAVCDLPDGPFRYAEGRFDPDCTVFDTSVPQLVGS
jgi:hypothetical protein